MQLRIALSLPRDEVSVPVVRRIAAQSMAVLGVQGECVDELQVALSEACANVLRHADADDDYEVRLRVDGETCVIDVVDRGVGVDLDRLGRTDAPVDAEAGRGIQLMRALVDEVEFSHGEPQGTTVSLTKHLDLTEDGVASRLAAARAAGRPVPHG